jgi:cytochrome P450
MRPPLTQAARITTVEVTLGPETVAPNRMVISWLLSANYDERQFPHPERFDIRRQPNRQFAFGHGIHFCLGAGLARIEGDIALRLLFDRFSELRAAPADELPSYEDPMFGVKELPVEVRRA